MELAPKPKSKLSINGLTQLELKPLDFSPQVFQEIQARHIFQNVWVWHVYPRGHRFLISFEEVLLPVSATPAGCCIDLPKEGVDYTRLSRTRVWRAGATS